MLDDIEIGEEYVCGDKTAKALSNWKMNVIRFLCLLVFLQGLAVKAEEVEGTSLTERAGYNFGGFFFTLFPMIVHPNINARSNAEKGIVKFHLYNRGPMTSRGRSSTRNKGKNFKLLDPTKMTENLSNFNTSLPTMILVHGFQETDSAIAVRGLLSAISRSGGWNVVFVDWHQLSAGPWYPWAIYNIRAAGRLVANFIDSLALAVEKNSNQTSNDIPSNRRSPVSTFLENLHIVGFSLGAHVAGIAGHHVSVGKVGRVTGLDPAYPLIELLSSKESRLDESDAEFVDIIHTSSGVYGTPYTSGHADFFPNGGKSIQPGCNSVAFPYVCSHWRSWRFFAESLLNPNSFESLPCESWEKFTDGECDHYLNDANNGPVNMGVGSRKTARGKYFLRTYPDPPFSMAL